MSNVEILTQVNTLMVRGGIAEHQALRCLRAGNRQKAAELSTFARAARTRAKSLMGQRA